MTTPTTLRFHWIMTVQYGPETSTLSNTAEVDAAVSRTEVYRDLRAHVAQKIGTRSFVVLYFALEPDQL
ncbi:hypothetical protein [Streptomyces sp. OK228]|uniref:hypothetical protein n=1 Tax=Streptomyces sp. OK228 TaxID=1882786 RepID=UPI000BD384C8|nr:hypothetical protein [Streptomyces sp. OK228]SOE27234.1 hypothetical protein SAMN05442782_4019 [Streptomyces sp. OK228]